MCIFVEQKYKNMKPLLLILLILFTSCQKMKYGNIISKHYEPENEYIYFNTIMISNGNNGFTTMMVPMYVHDNEDWVIEVSGIGVEGDSITREYYVTEQQYRNYKQGQFVCVEGHCDEDKNNIEKEQ